MTFYKKLLIGTIWAVAGYSVTAMAATDHQKHTAIVNGLANLYQTQQQTGYWNYNGYEQAATAAAVLAFLSQKDKWGNNAVKYQVAVDNAVGYLLQNGAIKNTVGVRSDGFNPCGTGTCTGVYWSGNGEATYTTGLVAPAIAVYAAANHNKVATTLGPLAKMTWSQIAQGIVNEFAVGQTTASNGNKRGGWRYFPSEGDSDGSTTQWAILAMLYSQKVGATIPKFVKDELKYWLAADQDPLTGAGCYQPPGSGTWCDHSDTGSLLLGLKFVGYDLSNSHAQAAMNYLNTHWTETYSDEWFGNFGHPYAMWSVYKALDSTIGLSDTTHITNLDSTCGAPNNLPGEPMGSVKCNWWEDYNDFLVKTQNEDGSWDGYSNWTGPLATSWYVSILGATEIPVNTLTPFSVFNINPLIINKKNRSLSVEGSFTLNKTSKDVNISKDAISITIGNLTFTVPQGGLRDIIWGYGYYLTDSHGLKYVLEFLPLGHNNYRFKVYAYNNNSISQIGNPVTVVLTIGSNSGNVVINALNQ